MKLYLCIRTVFPYDPSRQTYLFAIQNNKLHRAWVQRLANDCELKVERKGIDLTQPITEHYLKEEMKKVINEWNSIFEDDQFELNELEKSLGTRYDRIHRPVLDIYGNGTLLKPRKEKSLDYKLIMRGVNQLVTLLDLLDDILKVVHPEPSNLDVYGNQIKNLLVLACIEVEAQMKGVLYANAYEKKNKKGEDIPLSRNDYHKLLPVLKLNEYEAFFLTYMELDTFFHPFRNWEEPWSLDWYNAYNSVKHDGEKEFHNATLRNALNAVLAVAILLKAQYGDEIPFWKEKFDTHFRITSDIQWDYTDKLIPPLPDKEWESVKFNFSITN